MTIKMDNQNKYYRKMVIPKYNTINKKQRKTGLSVFSHQGETGLSDLSHQS